MDLSLGFWNSLLIIVLSEYHTCFHRSILANVPTATSTLQFDHILCAPFSLFLHLKDGCPKLMACVAITAQPRTRSLHDAPATPPLTLLLASVLRLNDLPHGHTIILNTGDLYSRHWLQTSDGHHSQFTWDKILLWDISFISTQTLTPQGMHLQKGFLDRGRFCETIMLFLNPQFPPVPAAPQAQVTEPDFFLGWDLH